MPQNELDCLVCLSAFEPKDWKLSGPLAEMATEKESVSSDTESSHDEKFEVAKSDPKVENEELENLASDAETKDQIAHKECDKWPQTLRKGTFALAHLLLILIPILLCYMSATKKQERAKKSDDNPDIKFMDDIGSFIHESIAGRRHNLTYTSMKSELDLPSVIIGPDLVRWRLVSLWMFPFLALPDITQNIWIFNAGIHRKKRFDISILMLLIMSSFPIMSLILATETENPALCDRALDSKALNRSFSIDVQQYAIFVSALIVVYRLLTRSRLMSRQVGIIST